MEEHSADEKRTYDRIASTYDFLDTIPERLFYRSWRRQLWSPLTAGRILEIGVGTGKNIPFYPAGAQVTAVDISPRMLDKAAERAATKQDVSIELHTMSVSQLSFKDDTFDAVVGSFIFTVIDDPSLALQEIMRVCRPGGRVHLLEFTRSDNRLVALIQDLLTPLNRAIYRARMNRDIVGLVRRSGFQAVAVEAVGDGIVRCIRAVVA